MKNLTLLFLATLCVSSVVIGAIAFEDLMLITRAEIVSGHWAKVDIAVDTIILCCSLFAFINGIIGIVWKTMNYDNWETQVLSIPVIPANVYFGVVPGFAFGVILEKNELVIVTGALYVRIRKTASNINVL